MLKDTPLETLNFSSFANIIKHSITPLDLEMLSKKLEEESLRLPEEEIEHVAQLRNIAMDLKSSRDLINLITNKIVCLHCSYCLHLLLFSFNFSVDLVVFLGKLD